MALFGFGKKKNQPAQQPVQKPVEPTPPPPVNVPNYQQFYMVNGLWQVNPNYDPTAKKPESKVKSSKAWSETVDNFLARNKDSKLFKLTGKPEDFADYEVGNRCKIEQDEDDDEKYNVICGDSFIGRLPSSAITYANKNDCPPEDLAVIIAEVDYDMEKDRDVISVYASV